MIYFTADTHFYHNAIIDYCKRPAPGWMNRQERVANMNSILVNRWNEKIGKEDEVYFLGDFAFCGTQNAIAIIEQLHGKKYWILGNHDYDLAKKIGSYFEWVRNYYVLRVHDKHEGNDGETKQYHQSIALMHFPILSWENMHHGTWHLHGHSHGSLGEQRGMRLDVGVDTNNLYPYSYEDVKKIMIMRSIVPVDHHKPKET